MNTNRLDNIKQLIMNQHEDGELNSVEALTLIDALNQAFINDYQPALLAFNSYLDMDITLSDLLNFVDTDNQASV